MSTDNTPQDLRALNRELQTIWNRNAVFWDNEMGEGNDLQRILIGPTTEGLLNLQEGELVLEVGCGNGLFARRMAQLGTHVVASDFSEVFLERARARTTENADRIEYRVVDATDEAQLVALGKRRFDAVVCNMAIMHMAMVDPLMFGVSQILKARGRFVFSVMHPCFNMGGARMLAEAEERERGREPIITRSVVVTKYLRKRLEKTRIHGQPEAHYYFHRPLHELFGACFRAGFVIDGLEEPAFDHPFDGSELNERAFDWRNYQDIPPILVVRLHL